MEETAAKSTKKKVSPEKLKRAFLEHLLMEGYPPKSVFAFAKNNKMDEADFYEYYNSFDALEKAIWADWFRETHEILEKDENFETYSGREKILAFFFTWFEELKKNRSYAMLKFQDVKSEMNPRFLSQLKGHFRDFVNETISDGKEQGEVAERPFMKQYDKAFWVQFLFLNKFWIKDDSQGFAKTDSAIEKSVNLAFDLISEGPVDTMIDFAKFLYQNSKSL